MRLEFKVKNPGDNFDKEHGMFVQFSNNIDRVLGHIIMRRHFERTFDAKKMVEESSVWAIVDTSIREVDWQIQ